MAAVGTPMRTLQEWMGHADHDTTLIYADYPPDERRDRDLVDRAFAPDSLQEVKDGVQNGVQTERN
jgi:integrase